MLKRIIQMSSNTDSVVMDCFYGSGGFLKESLLLEIKFIGIDESKEAIIFNQQWLEKLDKENLYKYECKIIKQQSYCLRKNIEKVSLA